MGETVIRTDVDKLIDLVKEKKEISVDDAAKELGISSKVVESLGDVLEEEGLLHMKYKFTTPYLEYEAPKGKGDLPKKEEEKLFIEEELDMKRRFFSKAKERGINDEKAKELWKSYVSQHKDHIKKQFFQEAEKKGYTPKEIESMWQKFEDQL
ncbi:MAG: hypothetical protein R6U32_06355 [Candidatus Woesearchaeota archaeon]